MVLPSGYPGNYHFLALVGFDVCYYCFELFPYSIAFIQKSAHIVSVQLNELSQVEHTQREKQNISSTPCCDF